LPIIRRVKGLLTTGLCALLAVLVLAGQAGARPAKHFTLNVGDAFIVAGTDLACATQVGKNVIKGHKLVTCFKIKGGGLAPGSYAVALGDNGRVVVAGVKADGNIGAPVFDRTLAAIGAGPAQITAHAGDEFVFSGTDIACAVNNDASGVYPTCFRATSKGGRPRSYAFAMTETFVAVVQFDATGKTTKAVFKRQHGR